MTAQEKFNAVFKTIINSYKINDKSNNVDKSVMWHMFLESARKNIPIGELAAAIESGKLPGKGD